MASIKKFYSVASIDHGGVIKPFAIQMIPAPVIFLPYCNDGTLGDMFKVWKTMKLMNMMFFNVSQYSRKIIHNNFQDSIIGAIWFFLLNCCTLAITFIHIMADVLIIHNVFHCDLYFINILFHFSEMDDKDKIYIGISNWDRQQYRRIDNIQIIFCSLNLWDILGSKNVRG